jgi:hypothetical protein
LDNAIVGPRVEARISVEVLHLGRSPPLSHRVQHDLVHGTTTRCATIHAEPVAQEAAEAHDLVSHRQYTTGAPPLDDRRTSGARHRRIRVSRLMAADRAQVRV